MKTIGLLGGMSWESTTHYYQLLNRLVNRQLGGLHCAKIVMVSVDFQPLERFMQQGNWEDCGDLLGAAARKVEAGGADFLLLCTNTLHKVADRITAAVDIPLLHIADATAEKVREEKMGRIGLLGTGFTMEEPFYRNRLRNNFGLEVIIPPPADRRAVHDIIFQELCHGIIRDESRSTYLRIIEEMHALGAEAVIEGCTEIGMLVDQSQTKVPLFDTTRIHAEQAVHLALQD